MDAEQEVARRDKVLKALGLPANATLLEGQPFTAEELTVVAKLRKDCGDEVVDYFSPTWLDRMVRGLYTNNKGTVEERLAEAVHATTTIAKWRKTDHIDTILTKQLKGDTTVMEHIRMTVGGDDLYGHVVWVEQLSEIASLCDGNLTVEEITLVRAQGTEAVESMKESISASLGLVRYKQIYVLDLAPMSFGSIITRADVRAMTKEIMNVGQQYYPEGMWKIFIINAPFIFRSVYAVISPMINPVTREKIKILGGPSSYMKEFQRCGVPAASVPKLIGGTHPGIDVLDLIRATQRAGAEAAALSTLDSATTPNARSAQKKAASDAVSATRRKSMTGDTMTKAARDANADSSSRPTKKAKKSSGGFCCGSASDVADTSKRPESTREVTRGDSSSVRAPPEAAAPAPAAKPVVRSQTLADRGSISPNGVNNAEPYETPAIVPIEQAKGGGAAKLKLFAATVVSIVTGFFVWGAIF